MNAQLHRIIDSSEAFETSARLTAGSRSLPLAAAFVQELPRLGVPNRFWRGIAVGMLLTFALAGLLVWSLVR